MNLKACKIGIICFLLSACSSDDRTVQSTHFSSKDEITKEEIYSWAKDKKALKVKTETSFENTYTDEILATTRRKFRKGNQFVLRGWVTNTEEIESIQVYTISAFYRRSENDWPNLNNALQGETQLDTTIISGGETLCDDQTECTLYEHVAVNFEDFSALKEQAVDGDLAFTLTGENDRVQYTIPGYYLKGFVLALQEYIDKRRHYKDTDQKEIKLKNRLTN